MTDRTLTEADIERIAARAVERFALAHPRPTQVTQQQAAEMLGVSPRTVHNYIRAGRLRLNRCGLVPIEEVDLMRVSPSIPHGGQ